MVSVFEDNADKGRDCARIWPFEVGDQVDVRAPMIGVCAEVGQNESFQGWLYSASWSVK
jgi:hypothetical protein